LETGGVVGARLLARMAVAFPERFEQVRAAALALLGEEHAESAPVRQAFAEALFYEVERRKQAPEVGTALLRPALRALLRDRAAGHLALEAVEVERFLHAVKDPVLRADMPRLPPRPQLAGFSATVEPPLHTFSAEEGGPWPVYDVAPLGEGRMLVALGEAGARLVNAEGRCVAHFDVPAFSLVRSVFQDRALALAPRGELQRLSRLDLSRRQARLWCDARVDAFAPRYDGDLWFIAVEDTVLAVDALAPDFRALWRVSQVGGRVRALAVGASEMSFVTEQRGGEVERWQHALPGPTLRARGSLPRSGGLLLHLSLRPDGELVGVERLEAPDARPDEVPSSGVRWLGSPSSKAGRPLPLPQVPMPGLLSITLGGSYMAMLSGVEGGHLVELLERTQGGARAHFFFEGPQPVEVRFVAGELVLYDGSGRLVRVDLLRSAVRRVGLR
jgi:hypothetical protein